ncbi:MAG: hypothetical protein WBD27_08065, partial [Pyrinomonadaceae bacterium]
MRIISGLLLFVLFGVAANGQQASSPKVIAEITASSDKVVKGSPFSAEAVSESVQVLADGNRIVRSSTSKLYRNSEGRFRREMSGGTGDYLGSMYAYGHGISILDPVIGHRYLLDSHLKTARVLELKSLSGLTTTTTAKTSDTLKKDAENKAIVAEKMAAVAKSGTLIVSSGQNVGGFTGTITSTAGGQGFAYSTGGHSKYETKTEQLGTQNVEGVNAEGTRTVTTIPAGAIGNERPIEMVYEKWYSNELQLVVMSKHSDPRFGEQTYRLTNIVRSEPDSSLFTLPMGYKVLSEPASVYRL